MTPGAEGDQLGGITGARPAVMDMRLGEADLAAAAADAAVAGEDLFAPAGKVSPGVRPGAVAAAAESGMERSSLPAETKQRPLPAPGGRPGRTWRRGDPRGGFGPGWGERRHGAGNHY